MSWLARAGLMGIFAATVTVAACGDSGGDSGPKSYAGMKQSVMISAKDGGTVAGGAVSLNIPADALPADTMVTLEVQDKAGKPDEDSIAIDIYEFGPSMQFKKPVAMEFDLTGVNLSNATASIAWLNGNKWEKLSDSKVVGGKISATTTHFTPFTVILTLNEDGDVVQAGGQCGGDFKACGGDITGTWKYTAGCITVPPGALGGSGSGDNPFAKCTVQPSAQVSIDLTGTATFGADGKFMTNQMVTTTSAFSVPNSCLKELGATCEQAKGMPEGDACVLDSGSDTSADNSSGTWKTEGTELIIMDSDSSSSDPMSMSSTDKVEYCVSGRTLTVRVMDGENGAVVHYTAEKQ